MLADLFKIFLVFPNMTLVKDAIYYCILIKPVAVLELLLQWMLLPWRMQLREMLLFVNCSLVFNVLLLLLLLLLLHSSK